MRILLTTLLAVIALTALGCTAQTVDDSTITAKVKTKLAADTRTSAIKIEVETVNGVVTLTGSVPTDGEKSAAEQVAKNTEDVKSVTNRIAVTPAASMGNVVGDKVGDTATTTGAAISDATILTKIKSKFVADGIIGTNVDVTNGVVLLKGVVDNKQEKTKAVELARTTEGVKSVDDKLTIKK
ncbi:MAG: BON domain-containing protein [Acidobacteriota bacterium]|nr:BON domain-containing protein [Acidobacteriota bacterium]